MNMGFGIAGFGLLFGFLLSRVGATDSRAIADMFLGRDLHLMGVIGVAIAVAGLGFYLMRRGRVVGADGLPLQIVPKPRRAGNLWGGVIFGAGWALTGACPGTVLAQIGEGQANALLTLGGIVLGTLIYRWVGMRTEAWLASFAPPRGAR